MSINKPETHEEMAEYMRYVGICEGIDFYKDIIENGWCENETEVEKYLDKLGIYPNPYYETSKENESYMDWKARMTKCESIYCVDCSHYRNDECAA
jgi:hypothetical protein